MVSPKDIYEIEIGKTNMLDFGRFQGNDLDQAIVFVDFKIQSTANDGLKDNFPVTGSYMNEKIRLKIDLSRIYPIMANSSVTGMLTIKNKVRKEI